MDIHAVAIGELLFDVFPDGERLGGAPSNFAFHAAALGARSTLISAVGDDDRGRRATSSLVDSGVDASSVVVASEKQTGIVQVEVMDGQPEYDIIEDVAWDNIELAAGVQAQLEHVDLVCWGTLGQRSCRSHNAHRQLFDMIPSTCLRVFDINFRMHYHGSDVVEAGLADADILKLNEDEVPTLREYVSGPRDTRDFLRSLRHRFDISTVVLTLGGAGCRVSAEDIDFGVPGFSVDVLNTVGAGDAFTAAFVLSQMAGRDLRTSAEYANRVGAYVATQDSGMPPIPERLRILS